MYIKYIPNLHLQEFRNFIFIVKNSSTFNTRFTLLRCVGIFRMSNVAHGVSFKIKRGSPTFVDSRLLHDGEEKRKRSREGEHDSGVPVSFFRPSPCSDNFSPVGEKIREESERSWFPRQEGKAPSSAVFFIFRCFSRYITFTRSLLVRQRFAQLRVERDVRRPRLAAVMQISFLREHFACIFRKERKEEGEREIRQSRDFMREAFRRFTYSIDKTACQGNKYFLCAIHFHREKKRM